MQSIDYQDNIEGVSAMYLCEVCNKSFALTREEEAKLGGERVYAMYTMIGVRFKYICDKCCQANWKFTEDGVLMNETPVKRRSKC